MKPIDALNKVLPVSESTGLSFRVRLQFSELLPEKRPSMWAICVSVWLHMYCGCVLLPGLWSEWHSEVWDVCDPLCPSSKTHISVFLPQMSKPHFLNTCLYQPFCDAATRRCVSMYLYLCVCVCVIPLIAILSVVNLLPSPPLPSISPLERSSQTPKV